MFGTRLWCHVAPGSAHPGKVSIARPGCSERRTPIVMPPQGTAMLHRRRFVSVLIVAFAFFVAVSPADAARKWCHRDPVVRVAGTLVKVDVAVCDDQQHLVTGAIAVKFTVPPGTATEVVMTDDGFKGQGERVTVEYDKRLKASSRSVQIRVLVQVPATNRMAAQVVVTPGTAKSIAISGSTNTEFTATTSVAPTKLMNEPCP
jgi:hypothetical protein